MSFVFSYTYLSHCALCVQTSLYGNITSHGPFIQDVVSNSPTQNEAPEEMRVGRTQFKTRWAPWIEFITHNNTQTGRRVSCAFSEHMKGNFHRRSWRYTGNTLWWTTPEVYSMCVFSACKLSGPLRLLCDYKSLVIGHKSVHVSTQWAQAGCKSLTLVCAVCVVKFSGVYTRLCFFIWAQFGSTVCDTREAISLSCLSVCHCGRVCLCVCCPVAQVTEGHVLSDRLRLT